MIFNVTGGGAGSGGTLVITAPAGVTCTVSKDGKTKTKTVDQYGYSTFKGLDTGTWTITISDGSETATATAEIVADYAKTMTFFAATIAVTFPEGSTCTCSDGNTTLTATDTSGSYTFTVPSAGDWTVSCTDGSDTDSTTVTITTNGQSESVELAYGVLYYKGNEYTGRTGGWKISGTGSKNAESIKVGFEDTGGHGTHYAQTVNKVDLTAFKTVTVHVTAATNNSSGGSVYVSIYDGTSNVVQTAVGSGKFTLGAATDIQLDASSISGSYYIRVVVTETATVSHTIYAAFDEVRCTA